MRLALDAKILITGHNETVGRAIMRHLQGLGYRNIVTYDERTPAGWDPLRVNAFFEQHLPDYVFLAPLSLHGVADDRLTPATWLRQTLLMVTSVIHASYLYEVDRLLCIDSDPTLFGSGLLDAGQAGPGDWYLQSELIAESQRARAAAGHIMSEMCDSYRTQYGCHFSSAVAGSLYGPGLRLDAPRGNLVSALFRKVLRAAETGQDVVELYGEPDAPCELLYIDDLADACLFLIEQLSEAGTISIRTDESCTLGQLAETVGAVTGYSGVFRFGGANEAEWPHLPREVGNAALRPGQPDASQQDQGGSQQGPGSPGRLRRAGWLPETTLEGGCKKTYRWFQRHHLEAVS